MTTKDDNEARQRRDLDLELENQALRKDLEIRGMTTYGKSDDLDPATENVFLNSIERMEDAIKTPFCKVRDLFPADMCFPPAGDLDDDQIKELMNRIESILADRQIYFALSEGVPYREIYRFFIEDVLEYDVLFENPPEGYSTVLDGCDGYCPGCFQRPYCESAVEDWE